MRYLFEPTPPTTLAIKSAKEVFPVRRIYCVGRNYVAHVVEMGGRPERSTPFFFAKPTDAVNCNPGQVPYPPATADLHHEVELVVALDGGGHNIDAAEAALLVFGFGVGVDLTRRDLQAAAKSKGQPWVTAKSFDHSAPVSALTPMTAGDLRGDAVIDLRVNGEVRQEGVLDAMIWSVPELIANLSGYFQLRPGDLIFTGTPSGVGQLQRGDRVKAGVEGIANLEFEIV